MKYLVSFIVFCGCMFNMSAQKDVIMLRNGLELEALIMQVGNDEVLYKEGKKSPMRSIELKDVYMLIYEKRGIVYITEDGKRVSEDLGYYADEVMNKDVPQWVYLIKGKVYPAYNLQILEDKIIFDKIVKVKSSWLGSKKEKTTFTFNKDEVFLIKYKDGTKDIITEFKPKEVPVEKESVVEEPEPQAESEEMQVVFHNVKNGDTLAKLAQRYNVTVESIKEWNDLPAKLKSTARLQTDMQLMIYVDIVKSGN